MSLAHHKPCSPQFTSNFLQHQPPPATHNLQPPHLSNMPSYQERTEVNDQVKQKQIQESEFPESSLAKWFRSLCGKLDRIPITPVSSLDFEDLIRNCSIATPRSELDHRRLESEARLVTESCRFTAMDSKELVYFIKQGLALPFGPKVASQVCTKTVEAIDELALTYPPSEPHKKDRRWDYLKTTHNILGVYRFANWFETGTSGHELNAIVKFFRQNSILVQILCLLFSIIDPTTYRSYWSTFQNDSLASSTLFFHVSRRACFHRLVLLRNLQADAHKDCSEVPNGWVALVCWGDFSGGNLVFPDLGVKLDFQPRDIVFFRSRLLEHFITDFEGERSSMIFSARGDSNTQSPGTTDAL